ncbi:MAG: RIP metalloprotease RseP [Acidobacteria bacterium RIFCSPLOWO2_12_FULL_67_14b]|nr:MAG: RIP metalloprotease RseP [Acidobacteria bacterium RIFCSPLOWO2_12_FULL_67_14b]
MTTLFAFLFVLGVLVFIHELGHFLLARWHGVRVITFSLGFGPKLLKMQRGDTEYCVSIIPLGGYVKMAGENPEDPHTGGSDEFLAKSKWQRFQILLAGPVMNLVLAVVLLAVVLMQGARVLAYLDRPAAVGMVQPGSPAERAGIQPGDVILKVGTADIRTWEHLDMAVAARPEREVPVVVVRNGREERLVVRPDLTELRTRNDARFEVGTIGVLPDVYPTIPAVVAGGPADKVGVKAGDSIVSINGKRMVFSSQVSEEIGKHVNEPIVLTVRREAVDHTFTVTPEQQGDLVRIGISLGDAMRSFTPSPIEAIGLSVERNIEMAGLILLTLRDLVTGEASPKQLMGPVGIAQLSGESAQAGWIALLALMASISLNLGLLNLMPIPVLDGGHIFIMAIETISRRDFSLQVKEKMLFVGFLLLMTLMVTVIYNDLTRIAWIENLMPWR